MNLWTQVAWTWPHIASTLGTVIGIGVLVLATWAITRAVTMRWIEPRMPAESADRILKARREAAHYRDLYERERETSAALRAAVRGSIGAASLALQQLQGVAAPAPGPRTGGTKPVPRRSMAGGAA